jgi:hypothetical protein
MICRSRDQEPPKGEDDLTFPFLAEVNGAGTSSKPWTTNITP